jgi:hypothetical protein
MKNLRNIHGTHSTIKQIRDLLPETLSAIGAVHADRYDLVLAAWPDIIGKKLAPHTEAISLRNGIFLVKVRNSTLYSVLVQQSAGELLQSLQEKFPSITIKKLLFRLG